MKAPQWFDYIRVMERRTLGTRLPPDFLVSFGPRNKCEQFATAEKAERRIEQIRDWLSMWTKKDVAKMLHALVYVRQDYQIMKAGGIADAAIENELRAMCERHGYGNVILGAETVTVESQKVPAYSDPRRNGGKGVHLTSPAENGAGLKIGGDRFSDPNSTCRKHGSRSNARKMASAMIAKIPLPLAQHIAAVYYPR